MTSKIKILKNFSNFTKRRTQRMEISHENKPIEPIEEEIDEDLAQNE